MKQKRGWYQNKLVMLGIILCLLTVPMATTFAFIKEESSLLYTYEFSDPSLEKQMIHDQMYTVVSIPALTNTGMFSHPSLPIKQVSLLLPKDSSIKNIQFLANDQPIQLRISAPIKPVPASIPLTNDASETTYLMNETIYTTSTPYPNRLGAYIDTYQLRGYHIAVINLFPLQFQPKENMLYYYSSITVSLSLQESFIPRSESLLRGNAFDQKRIVSSIDNPEILQSYPVVSPQSDSYSENYDLLILTKESFVPAFSLLKQAHDLEGVQTKITTLSELADTQVTTIRSYIREEYLSHGIEYVLLGGDDPVVPACMLWVEGLDEGVQPYETIMPSDLYYACLDGPFNYDEDIYWGEQTDGTDGGDVDLLAEVYVGRACVDTLTEAYYFVNKTISYLQSLSDRENPQYLFAGEHLGDYGIATWGGNYLDQLIDGSSADGYETVGVPQESVSINTLYDRDTSWYDEDILTLINNGIHVLNHNGHSNYQYNMRCSLDDVMQLENTQYCFVYSQGCNAGGFASRDCFAEYMTVKSEHGAVAGIWNARYGWFWSYSTDGDSQRFHREFWDAVYNEDIYSVGAANQDSKEDNLYLINRSCIRWCYYQLNLFGDPTLRFTSIRPNTPDKPVGPGEGTKETVYTYQTVSTSPKNLELYYQWDWDDGRISEWIGPFDSGAICETTHQWDRDGSYAIRVKAKDSAGWESDWSDPLVVRMAKQRMYPFSFPIFKEQSGLLSYVQGVFQEFFLFFSV